MKFSCSACGRLNSPPDTNCWHGAGSALAPFGRCKLIPGARVQAVRLLIGSQNRLARLRRQRLELPIRGLEVAGRLPLVAGLGPDLGGRRQVQRCEEAPHDAQALWPEGLDQRVAAEAHQHPRRLASGATRALDDAETARGAPGLREVEEGRSADRRVQRLRRERALGRLPREGADRAGRSPESGLVQGRQRATLGGVCAEHAGLLETSAGRSHDEVVRLRADVADHVLQRHARGLL
eukprot:CAMPEP_0204561688 /NCGR_PEP_ID=MMETSP0661-20131031/33329_1 /ASSEMBLY_ACC=CAM_ASM_000606 /TAXON_ID=109239 /ORGANISM="Alexandrium margalefi, Strain AMGDE01CS-322" /LENGTH=236 /DNA_ID=CAMNT_0051569119 /DNA_START=241 /DNA_END=947 /DNA_ORIENTATION=+